MISAESIAFGVICYISGFASPVLLMLALMWLTGDVEKRRSDEQNGADDE